MATDANGLEALKFLSETTKQLISLSTAILAFTVTFLGQIKKAIRQDPSVGRSLRRMWLMQSSAIAFGLIALLIVTGQIGRLVTNVYAPNLRIVFGLQLFCFGAGALYLGRIGGALLTAVKVPKAAQQQDAEPTLERLSFPSPREQPKPQGLGSQTIDDDQQVG